MVQAIIWIFFFVGACYLLVMRSEQRRQTFFWDFSLSASWRKHRYTAAQLWSNMRDIGVDPPCMFSLPGMSLDFVMIDILHALDLGVSQDTVGNILWEVLKSALLPGDNMNERCKGLWHRLLQHYRAYDTPSRLQALTVEMIRKQGKGPKTES